MKFTTGDHARYKRQLMLEEIGIAGQERIRRANVLVIGAGGLGSAILQYLGAAGVGTIGIADGDVVELSNLQRQVIHFTSDLNRPKVDSAKEKIEKLNPHVSVNVHDSMITKNNIMGLVSAYDFVLDGTDNFPSKFLINDACILSGIPFSHAGILHYIGQTMTILPHKTACYRCVFGEPPPSDSDSAPGDAGVFGPVAGTIGTIQAAEAIKFIVGKGNLLADRLLVFDSLKMEFRTVRISKNKSCPVCGAHPSITI